MGVTQIVNENAVKSKKKKNYGPDALHELWKLMANLLDVHTKSASDRLPSIQRSTDWAPLYYIITMYLTCLESSRFTNQQAVLRILVISADWSDDENFDSNLDDTLRRDEESDNNSASEGKDSQNCVQMNQDWIGKGGTCMANFGQFLWATGTLSIATAKHTELELQTRIICVCNKQN